jgi:hypothetical protein
LLDDGAEFLSFLLHSLSSKKKRRKGKNQREIGMKEQMRRTIMSTVNLSFDLEYSVRS